MTDDFLIRFLMDQLTPEQEQEVLTWMERDKANVKYIIHLKSLWVSQNMPDTLASEKDLELIRKNIKDRHKIRINYKIILPYALAACFAVAFFLNIPGLFHSKSELNSQIYDIEKLSAENKTEIYTEKGVKAKVVLPDGSKINLNSDTRLIYPNKFEGDRREVFISGEAFFDVVKDSLKPMIVSTNKNFKVEVLGTSFNIRTYENDSYSSITLYSGKINLLKENIRSGSEELLKVEPLQSVLIGEDVKPVIAKTPDLDNEKAWKDGFLVFESITMSEVIKRLERWHGSKFTVLDNNILKLKVTANFQSESIIQIMELLKYSIGINYEIQNNVVILK